MSKVSLRVYNKEIEGMIENGQLDDSIVHCLHILKTFPMHLETYRLLGKAFLEGRQYANAADIFQRVLMAVPDDFVSHVGMSIIADDENKLDDAIWHMERAFEIQPSNPAIQGELRRLYGRREGVEPPRIRLTRDALANMYAQGELYNQAIAEIRSVLAEDPDRPDLQVMLARAYFRAGQKVEATEMCSALLRKYPYCLDALRILTEILPGTGRAENASIYRHRINLLDPYSTFATVSVFQSDKVSDAAVNLERLEYEPGTRQAPSQPDWASSLGIKIEEPVSLPAAPDWLSMPVGQQPDEPSPIPTEQEAAKQENIPDWMRKAGWKAATGEPIEEQAEDHEVESAAEPISQAEIPDWLKAMAPPDISEESQVAGDKLVSFGEFTSDSTSGEEIPDWLRPPETDKVEEPPVTIRDDSHVPLAAELSIGQELSTSEDELPDWLQELAPASEVVPAEEGIDGSSASAVSGASDLEDKPEEIGLVSEMEKPEEPQRENGAKPFEEGLSAMDDQDAAMAWLESLAAKQGAKEEELLTKREDRLENAPDWVKKLTADETVVAAPAEAQEVPGPELVSELPVAEALSEPVLPAGDTTLDWLESVDKVEEIVPEEPIKPIDESLIEFLGEDSLVAEETLVPPVSKPEIPHRDEEITVTTWLQKLPREEPAVEEMPDEEPSVAGPSEELPDWLRDMSQAESTSRDANFVEQPPDWLRIPPEEVKEESAKEPELPDWLSETTEPVEKTTHPTSPQEWMLSETTPVAEELSVPEHEAEQPAAHPMPVTPGSAAMPPRISLQEKESDMLRQAQDSLEQGSLNSAMDVYTRLIKKGRMLDEVIHDLHEAIYRFPVDMIVWQTLGDAYMRANRLQEALDAYTKAEELLR